MTVTDDYNDVAIRTAARLHEFRRSNNDMTVRRDRPLVELLPDADRTALGAATEYEIMGNQPVTDELAAAAADHGIEFEHLGMTLGTVLHGLDLGRPASNDLVAVIRRTLLERKVIFFRDQHLDPGEQVAFARNFGELDAFPFGRPGADPFILEIHHGAGSPGTENGWHSDVTWMENPSLGSIAQCVVCPPTGGDTLFADSHAAFHGLPADLAERAEHLDVTHDYRVFLQGRGFRAMPEDMIEQIKTEIPFGVVHPLVRTHPETGKPAIYLNGGFVRAESLTDRRTGEPLGPEVSRAMMARLLRQHDRPEYQCRFRWTEGSIAFWDNRAVQHYAASDYYPHKRLLRRVTLRGDRPYFRPA